MTLASQGLHCARLHLRRPKSTFWERASTAHKPHRDPSVHLEGCSNDAHDYFSPAGASEECVDNHFPEFGSNNENGLFGAIQCDTLGEVGLSARLHIQVHGIQGVFFWLPCGVSRSIGWGTCSLDGPLSGHGLHPLGGMVSRSLLKLVHRVI